MKGPQTAILLLLCYLSYPCFAQDQPDKATAIINFPSKFFHRIQSKAANLDEQLIHQTEKYLQKMARREERLRKKLYKIDPNAAKNLFSGTAEQRDIRTAEESSRLLAEGFYHLVTAPFLGGAKGLLFKFLVNSAIEFSFNGKDADVGDLFLGEIPYAGVFLQSAFDYKPFSANQEKFTTIFNGTKSGGEFTVDFLVGGAFKLLNFAGDRGGIHDVTVNGKKATKEQIEYIYGFWQTFIDQTLQPKDEKENKN